MNSVSIIIPTHNNGKFIGALLDTVLTQDYSSLKEVFIVDSGDDDTHNIARSYETLLKERGITLNVERVPNRGVSYSRNFGARKAHSSLLFFLDSDCLLKKNSIRNIVEYYFNRQKEEAVGAIQCKILHRRKNFHNRIASAGAEVSKLGYGWGRLTLSPKDSLEANRSEEVLAIEGTGFLIDKAVFLGVGGFDEYFFFFFEPSDLSLKLLLSDLKILYCPLAEIFDFKGGSRLSMHVPERIKRFIKYHIAFLLKFYPLRYLIAIIPVAVVIDMLIALVIAVKCRSPRTFLSFVEVVHDLPILMEKRSNMKTPSEIQFKEIWRRMSSRRNDVKWLLSSARHYGWLP